MDSNQLTDYLYRAKADINRSLDALKGISSETDETMNAVCETEKLLQSAKDSILGALQLTAAEEKPDLLEDIAMLLNDSDEGSGDYGTNSRRCGYSSAKHVKLPCTSAKSAAPFW